MVTGHYYRHIILNSFLFASVLEVTHIYAIFYK
jgi:hypothetical protein